MLATLLLSKALVPSRQPLRHPRPRLRPLITMGGGIKQPRPTEPFDPAAHPPAVDTLPEGAALPRLVVFDLDNTVWTPELYTLRHFKGYADASPPNPVAGKDVWLLDGAAAALHELATHERWRGTQVAAASRTNKPRWAGALLREFDVPGCSSGRKLAELIPYQEIYPGSKTVHFEELRAATGVAYDEMLFFDDSDGGKYGNCEPVSRMGLPTGAPVPPALF